MTYWVIILNNQTIIMFKTRMMFAMFQFFGNVVVLIEVVTLQMSTNFQQKPGIKSGLLTFEMSVEFT